MVTVHRTTTYRTVRTFSEQKCVEYTLDILNFYMYYILVDIKKVEIRLPL